MIKREQINLYNMYAFVQGCIRYWLYYSKFICLIRRHIREQIKIRICSMRSVCYTQGYCEVCGCKTTHLQMANKACDGVCYPAMIAKKKWIHLKKLASSGDGHAIYNTGNIVWNIDFNQGKFIQSIITLT